MTEQFLSRYGRWKTVLALYLLLLLCSHLWRALYPIHPTPAPDQRVVSLHQVRGDSLLEERTLPVAYRDRYRGDEAAPPVILLLHGSPAGHSVHTDLIDSLSSDFRVIAPDFPGYEASRRKIPDYSMEAYSLYMKQLLDSLEIDRVHLVGYSFGTGVAIRIAHDYPGRVASTAMIGGLGVQELELMGNYALNRTIYGGQLALIWLLHEAVPHFGWFQNLPLNVAYARTFYESDQRPLRGYLQEYDKPMLILHGRDDRFVPPAAAREHHRIVPQSRLKIYNGGHALVTSHTGQLVSDLTDFIGSAEAGDALTRSDAPAGRREEARKPFSQVDFAEAEGITLVIMMVMIIFASFVSEDLACIGAGLLAARGLIGFFPATAASFIGIIIGDFTIFLLGRYIGEPLARRKPLSWFISADDLDRSTQWFKVRGPMLIFGSRFIPGSRLPTYFSAGMIGMPFYIFTLYFLIAGAVWTPLLVGLSTLLGVELIRYFQVYETYALWILPAVLLALWLFVKWVMPAVTWRGRRLIVSRWRRLTQWEYWPPYMLYAPIVPYILFSGLKRGALTLFTAANPGIPGGGFIGESKSAILGLGKSRPEIARFCRIPSGEEPGDRLLLAREFIRREELQYPVVVKPDVGQRGEGVCFPASYEELQQIVEDAAEPILIQEYVEGKEYGVFFYRFPGQRGKILSVTEKQLPVLTGDGRHTVEELILSGEQTLAMAPKHLESVRKKLYTVPEQGEQVTLVRHGTHARGARFYDARHLITERLISAIRSVAKSLPGFYFGRLDIRVPSPEHLQRGEGIKILEINGVTSESTIIYDPERSYFDAVRHLMHQWDLAFKIGKANWENGAEVDTVFDLASSIAGYIRVKKEG